MFRNTAKNTRKILVSDLDGCITVLKPGDISTNQFLSKHLINFVISQSYDSFYICTHRCKASIPYAIATQQKQVTKIMTSLEKKRNNLTKAELESDAVYQACKLFEESDPSNIYTFKVIDNFSKSVSLPLHAVSTPDDGQDSCGTGYEKKIKPLEDLLFQNQNLAKSKGYNFEINPLEYDDGEFPDTLDPLSKNKQLLTVAKDIAIKFPNTKITLDYVDDNLTLCVAALMLPKHSEWPTNIAIHVFQHDPFTNTEINSIQSPQDINVKKLLIDYFHDYNLSDFNYDNVVKQIQTSLALINQPYIDIKLLMKHVSLISKFPYFSIFGGSKEIAFDAEKWFTTLRGSNYDISSHKPLPA